MKKIAITIIVIAIAAMVLGVAVFVLLLKDHDKLLELNIPFMKITSPAFENNSPIPSKYTCDGENISPPLALSEVPPGAKSLVLISDDPDAPAGTWVHWLVWNIDPKITEIAEGSAPAGAIEGTTSSGKTGYGGPCPPSGEHRYFFRIYALDTMLELGSEADKGDLVEAMQEHILAKGEIMGLYSRK